MILKKIKYNIAYKQKIITEKLKKKIKIYNTEGFYPNYDIPIYFSPFSDHIGVYSIKENLNLKSSFFKKLITILRDFFVILKYLNISAHYNLSKQTYDKAILSWGLETDFEKNGSFNDRYLNINSSKTKKTYWIIIYLGKKIPKKINKNILIIHVNKNRNYNLISFVKFILLQTRYIFKSFQFFLFSISSSNFLSWQIFNTLKNKIDKNIKKFLIVYEAQPFQNRLIKYLQDLNIYSIGYIHFPPLALPLHLIKKKYSPNKIILNGEDQIKCFQKLGWSKKDIKLCASTRFLKKKIKYNNKIFLPISIKSSKIIIESLNTIIYEQKINLKHFEVQNHPLAKKSKIHLELIKKINQLLQKPVISNIKFRKIKKFSIFIGASGAIIEALERGASVMQIAEEPILDQYSTYFWENLKIKKLSNNICTYRLSKKQNLIKFGSKPQNLKIYFD